MNRQVNLNGNLMCVIDTETTGLDSNRHEIIEICVLPLDSDCKPLEDVKPLHMYLRPDKPENIDPEALRLSKLSLADVMNRGLDQFKAVDLFYEWFETLPLPVGRKIVPLGQNYIFDRGFISKWLGESAYNTFFHYHYRDTQVAALYLNDHAIFHAEKPPFPKVSLSYISSQLNVKNLKAHTALSDCITTAECYRRMIKSGTFTV